MANFPKRHIGYKVGVISLYITTFLFFVGNFDPQWLRYSMTETNTPLKQGGVQNKSVSAKSSPLAGCSKKMQNRRGPYGTSSEKSDGCGLGFFVDTVSGAWVHVCQTFEAIAIVALVVACVYTTWAEFCKKELGPRRRFVEIGVVAAGVSGLLGAVIFAGKMGSTVKDNSHYSFGWAVFFTIVVSILIVVDGVVIAIFNRPDPSVPYAGMN